MAAITSPANPIARMARSHRDAPKTTPRMRGALPVPTGDGGTQPAAFFAARVAGVRVVRRTAWTSGAPRTRAATLRRSRREMQWPRGSVIEWSSTPAT